MPFDYAVFGGLLKNARKAAGLSQDDLASKARMSRSSLANVERGVQRVMLHQAINLAQAAGLPLQSLLQEAPEAEAVEQLRSRGMDDLAVLDWVQRAATATRGDQD